MGKSGYCRKIWIILFVLAFLGGCKGKTGEEKLSPEEQGTEAGVEWREQGFSVSDIWKADEQLQVSDYVLWEYDREGTEGLESRQNDWQEQVCVFDSRIYRLTAFASSEEEGGDHDPQNEEGWLLECYDTSDASRTRIRFGRRELGLEEGTGGYLVGMDLTAEDAFVFQYVNRKETPEGAVQIINEMIYTNLKGDSRQVSLQEAYLESGVERERWYTESGRILPDGECICDGKGNTYRLKKESGEQPGAAELLVFDEEGKAIVSYSAGENGYLGPLLRTQDGEMVCAEYDRAGSAYRFLWVDTERARVTKVGEMKDQKPCIQQFFGMLGNNVYYEMTEGQADGVIVRWNIKTGEREKIFSYKENGFARGNPVLAVLREGNQPCLWMQVKKPESRQFVVSLSGKSDNSENRIRVCDIAEDQQHLNGKKLIPLCASIASQSIPGKLFSYETEKQNPETYRDRILAEIASGGGPDILYVSREDMFLLEEKGALMDLGTLLPESAAGRILPGALELGTIGGKLVGIPPDVTAESVVVPERLWKDAVWKLEDMLDLMERGALQPLMGGENGGDYYFASLATQYGILRNLIADSFLIDWEKRECHFDDERILRFLKVTNVEAKNLANDPQLILNGGTRMVQIYLHCAQNLLDFGECEEIEGGNYVGSPTEGACGHYLIDDGFIVVNRNTTKTEEIQSFLECFLSKEIQASNANGLQITKMTPENIHRNEAGELIWVGHAVHIFEDGSSSLDRAEAFLEGCVAQPRIDSQLDNILYEELEALYLGERTPEQTAEILNNRIGLYLKETE